METSDYWGWISPAIVWVSDHYGCLFACILFGLQAAVQIYRLNKLREK